MVQLLSLVAVIFTFVALAMLGLAAGALLKKRTPLKGSCHGASCSTPSGGEGCRCAGQGASEAQQRKPRLGSSVSD